MIEYDRCLLNMMALYILRLLTFCFYFSIPRRVIYIIYTYLWLHPILKKQKQKIKLIEEMTLGAL